MDAFVLFTGLSFWAFAVYFFWDMSRVKNQKMELLKLIKVSEDLLDRVELRLGKKETKSSESKINWSFKPEAERESSL